MHLILLFLVVDAATIHYYSNISGTSENVTVGDLVMNFSPSQTLKLLAISPTRMGTDPSFAFTHGELVTNLGDVTIQTAAPGGGWLGWRTTAGKVVALNSTDRAVILVRRF
jgi:hypothetical protein